MINYCQLSNKSIFFASINGNSLSLRSKKPEININLPICNLYVFYVPSTQGV